jgi:hypothetical protein
MTEKSPFQTSINKTKSLATSNWWKTHLHSRTTTSTTMMPLLTTFPSKENPSKSRLSSIPSKSSPRNKKDQKSICSTMTRNQPATSSFLSPLHPSTTTTSTTKPLARSMNTKNQLLMTIFTTMTKPLKASTQLNPPKKESTPTTTSMTRLESTLLMNNPREQ